MGGSSCAGSLTGRKAREDDDFLGCERQRRLGRSGQAMGHRQPEYPPAQNTEQGQEIDEAFGRTQLRSFGLAADFRIS